MDGVRIRYSSKKSVFCYGGIAREDAVAKAWEHVSMFPREQVGESVSRAGLPVGGETREIPLTDLIVEYVTNLDTPSETAERVPFPPAQ